MGSYQSRWLDQEKRLTLWSSLESPQYSTRIGNSDETLQFLIENFFNEKGAEKNFIKYGLLPSAKKANPTWLSDFPKGRIKMGLRAVYANPYCKLIQMEDKCKCYFHMMQEIWKVLSTTTTHRLSRVRRHRHRAELPIIFVKIFNYICPNCQLYLSKLSYDARNMTTHRLSPVRRHRHRGAKLGEILSPLSPPGLS